MHPESDFQIAPNWPEIGKMTMTPQFSDMTSSSNSFDVALFLLSSLVTGPSFMSISSLVRELWQFTFMRDRPVSGDLGELGIPSLAAMCLMKCYEMLQNARVTAFTVSELLRKTSRG